jgi:hypothetical protein
LKILSKLLNKNDEAEAYMSSTVLGFLLTWQEATTDEKAIEAKVEQEFVNNKFSRIFYKGQYIILVVVLASLSTAGHGSSHILLLNDTYYPKIHCLY